MTWRELITKVGTARVAKEMGVKFPTVHRWSKPGARGFPRPGVNGGMKDLIPAMHKLLSAEDFLLFMNSLSSEITGFGIERPPTLSNTGTEG